MTPISQVEPPVIEMPVDPVEEDDRVERRMHPAGYRILVQIPAPEKALSRWRESNLTMPDEVRDREWGAAVWAIVIELGPEAYQDERKFRGSWCKPGDTIMMRPYSGTRFMVRGHLYALINDDTVQAVVHGDAGEVEGT